MAQSHFYGTVHSHGDTDASRTGKKSDGLELNGFTKDHILEVHMYWNESRQQNMVQLRIRSRDSGKSHLIFHGSEALLWNDAQTADVLAKDYLRRLMTGEAPSG